MSPNTDRLGFHYYPDEEHYTQAHLTSWLPTLQKFGVRWLTLHASLDKAVPEHFIRGLIQSGITPIIHIPVPVQPVRKRDLLPLLSSYQNWGIRYVILFDQPNVRTQWDPAAWSKGNLIEQFLDTLVPVLNIQHELGLAPVFPPLQPGGDYWDTAFLESSLDGISRRGGKDLLRKLTLSIYAWTNSRPLDWGIGGPANWPETRPYRTPEGSQDQIGLRIFDWYAAISEGVIGVALPTLVVAGGETCVPDREKGTDLHAERNLAIARGLGTDEIPALVQNFNFYPLSKGQDVQDSAPAWFASPEAPSTSAEYLLRFVTSSSGSAKEPAPGKPIAHYVLLPLSPNRNAARDWSDIEPYVLTMRPVVGFSAQEATLARKVSLIGNEAVFPSSIEEMLRNAGCEVHRFNENIGESLLGSVSDAPTASPIQGATDA